MQASLKLGFFIQPVHPPSRPYADVLREDREAVVLADRLGYREAFIGEHLVDAAETITSSLAFIANLADACPSITFGTGVLPLANYHPAMAAAQVAMVDHLVRGRLVLGVGPGVRPAAEAIGDLGSDRNRKTQEALEHMCRIWSEEPPYRIEGEFYRTTTEGSFDPQIGVGGTIRPLQKPHPPIAITSIRPDGRGPHATGARGWTGISASYVGAYVVHAHIQSYLEGRRSAGLSADASGWRVARSVFVADEETTARRHAYREDGAHGFYFHVMKTKLAKAGAQGRDARLSRPAGFRALDEAVHRASRDRRRASQTRFSISATRLARSARCSTPGTTGSIRRSRGARWSSWRTRSCPGSIEPCVGRARGRRPRSDVISGRVRGRRPPRACGGG